MKKVHYQKYFWDTRTEIDSKGCKQPVNEMIKRDMLKPPAKQYDNILAGKTQSIEFLEKLVILKNVL